MAEEIGRSIGEDGAGPYSGSGLGLGMKERRTHDLIVKECT